MALVKGGGAVSPDKIQTNDKANSVILNDASDSVEFTTNGSLVGLIDSSGNITFGTGSGAQGIEIVRSLSSTNFGALLRNSSDGDVKLTLALAAQSYSLGIDNSDSDKFKISTSTTDVGVGTIFDMDSSGNIILSGTLDAGASRVSSSYVPAANADLTNKLYVDTEITSALATQNELGELSDVNLSGTLAGSLLYSTDGTLWANSTDFILDENDNQFKLPTGSFTNPSLSFTADTDTGFYLSATDEIATAIGGAKRTTFRNFGVLVPDGGASAPSYSFLSDDDTGDYYTTVPSKAVVTVVDGSEILRKTSVALEMTARVQLPDGLINTPSLFRASDDDTGLYFPGADQVSLVGGGAGLTVNAGNVGINTLTPDAKLEIVEGDGTSPVYASDDLLIVRNNSGTGNDSRITIIAGNQGQSTLGFGDEDLRDPGRVVYDHSSDFMSLYTNAVERLRVDSAGNIGVNTTTPDSLLHLFKGSAGAVTANAESALTLEDDGAVSIQFLSPNTANQELRFGDPENTGVGVIRYDHSNNRMEFGVNGTNQIFVSSDGSLGIGRIPTSTNAVDIFRSGDNAIVNITSDTDNSILLMESAASPDSCVIRTNTDLRIDTGGANRRITVLGSNGYAQFGGTKTPEKYIEAGDGLDALDTSNQGIAVNVAGSAALIARDSTNDVEINLQALASGVGVVGTQTSHNVQLRAGGVPALVATTVGNVAIGGSTVPNARLDVSDSVGALPTFSSDDVAILRNNGTVGNNAGLAIIAGSAGSSQIVFGDDSAKDSGRIVYNHNTNELTLGVNDVASSYVFDSNNLTLPADPTSSLHAVTKQYVDGLAAGLDPKGSVRAVPTSNLGGYSPTGGTSGTGGFTNIDTTVFDGHTNAVTDRILVINQTDPKENGIYVITVDNAVTGAMERATDHDGTPSNEVSGGNTVFVENGTIYSGRTYALQGNGDLTLNTNDLVWQLISNATDWTWGNGLVNTSGNVVEVDPETTGTAQTFGTLSLPSGKLAVDLGFTSTVAMPGNASLFDLSDVFDAGVQTGQMLYKSAGDWRNASDLYWDETNDRLGIGFSSPNDTLAVDGNVRANNFILNGNTASGIFSENNRTHSICISTANSALPDLCVGTTGNVGIGTDSPDTALHIEDATDPTITFQRTSGAGKATILVNSEGRMILSSDPDNTGSNPLISVDVGGSNIFNFKEGAILDYAGNTTFTQSGTNLNFGGIFGGGWDHINFYTDGLVRATLDNTGFGIGTSTPGELLHLDATTGNNAIVRLQMGTGAGGANNAGLSLRNSAGTEIFTTLFNNSTAQYIIESDLNANAFTIERATGRVGLGRPSPVAPLDIAGSINAAIINLNDTVENWRLNSRTGGHFSIDSGTTSDILYLERTGNVGIGTDNPLEQIHVVGSDADMLFQSFGDPTLWYSQYANGTEGAPTIVNDGDAVLTILGQGYDGSSYRSVADIQFEVDGTPGTADMPGRIVFQTTTNGSSTLTERMRITETGNVNIGTTTELGAASLLNVSGYAYLQRVGSSVPLRIGADGSNDIFMATGEDLRFSAEDNIVFKTGTLTEKARFDSNGNFGIGVTPESWQTGYTALQLGATAAVWSETDATLTLSQNLYRDGVGRKYLTTGASSAIELSNGQISFARAVSGTADTALTLVQTMLLNSNGTLLLNKSGEDGISSIGHQLNSTGFVSHSRDNANVMQINRNTSDGSIVQFYKDQVSIGQIRANSGNMEIQSSTLVVTGALDASSTATFSSASTNAIRISGSSVDFAGIYGTSTNQDVSIASNGTGSLHLRSGGTSGGLATSTSRVTVLSGGNVGIGRTDPQNLLHVAGAAELDSVLIMNSQIRADDGAANFCSYAFESDTDTGIFRPAADTLGFACGGTERMTLSSTALDLTPGTVSIGGTSNNAIINNQFSMRVNIDSNNNGTTESFIIGHDQTGINQNNIIAKFQEDGKVAIGDQPTPDSLLHVWQGNAGTIGAPSNTIVTIENSSDAYLQFLSPATADQMIRFGDPSDTGVGSIRYSHSSNEMIFATNGGNRLYITSLGRVGINEASPGVALEINDGNSGGSTQDSLIISDSGNFQNVILRSGGADGEIFVGQAGQRRMRISGNTMGTNINGVTCNIQGGGTTAITIDGTNQHVEFPQMTTTTSAANAFLDTANNDRLLRSTSSMRYKQDVKPLTDEEIDLVFSLDSMTYRSKVETDDQTKRHFGFTAEHLHENVSTRLVNYDAEGRPDGVQYERITVLLAAEAKRQKSRAEEAEAKVSELEDRLNSLETLLKDKGVI